MDKIINDVLLCYAFQGSHPCQKNITSTRDLSLPPPTQDDRQIRRSFIEDNFTNPRFVSFHFPICEIFFLFFAFKEKHLHYLL